MIIKYDSRKRVETCVIWTKLFSYAPMEGNYN